MKSKRVIALAIVLTMVVLLSGCRHVKEDAVVAKAGKENIYSFEFEYYLKQTIYEEFNTEYDKFDGKTDNFNNLSPDEKAVILTNSFFDESRREKCKNAALEKARVFKAEYAIAVNKGYELTDKEKKNVNDNLEFLRAYYLETGVPEELVDCYLTGGSGLTLSYFIKYEKEYCAIEKYKAALKETFTISDTELRKVYNEDPAAYREVDACIFAFDIPPMPRDENGEPVSPDSKTPADREAYQEYVTTLDDYINEAEAMKAAIDDGSETNENATYYMVPGGILETISVNNSSGVDEIDDYVLSAQWNSERTGFVTKTDSTPSRPTKVEIIKVTGENGLLKALYLVRVENIHDIDSPYEEYEYANGWNQAQKNVAEKVFEENATAELEEAVLTAGDKYSLKEVNEAEIKKVMDKLFGVEIVQCVEQEPIDINKTTFEDFAHENGYDVSWNIMYN